MEGNPRWFMGSGVEGMQRRKNAKGEKNEFLQNIPISFRD